MTEPMRRPAPGRRTGDVAPRGRQPDGQMSSAIAVPGPAPVPDTVVPASVPIAALRRPPGDPVIRRKWDQQAYQVSGTERILHVEQHKPVWGNAG